MTMTPGTRQRNPRAGLSAGLQWAGLGLWVSAYIASYTSLFGSGLLVMGGTLAALTLGAVLLPQPRHRRFAMIGPVLGALGCLGAQSVLAGLPADLVPAGAFGLAVLAAWGVSPLLACQSLALNPLSGSLLLAGTCAGYELGVLPALFSAIALGGCGAWLAGSDVTADFRTSTDGIAHKVARTFAFLAVLIGLGAGLSVLRSPLTPATAGALAGFVGVIAGLSLPGSRAWGRVWMALGASGAAGIAFLAGALPPRMAALTTWLAAHSAALTQTDRPALLVLAATGLAAGAILNGIQARPREQAWAAVAAAGLLPFALPLLSTETTEHAASALVSVGADSGMRERLDAQRARLPVQFASFTAAGPALVRGKKGELLAELDGSVVDPDSRAARGERFAGTLGACLTDGRSQARVAGDDMGIAVKALLSQGFHAVDTAVPDPARMQVWADLAPLAKAAWTHPATRILGLPAPFVAQGGAPADVVVNILRNGWTDARQALPSPAALSATRRSLFPGGVYVLSVSTTRIDADAFIGLANAVSAAFPSVTVWLPPVGVDTAIFVARPEASPTFAWSRLASCIATDREELRHDAIRSPNDLAGLLLGDGTIIPTGDPPSGLRMPQRLAVGDPNPLARLNATNFDAATAWAGAEAEAPDLRARHESLLRFQDAIAQAAAGDMQAAVKAARTLSTAPGGGRSVETLVRGYLDRARSLIEHAGKEGPSSKSWGPAETALANARLLYPDLGEAWCVEGRMDELRGQLPRAEEAYTTCAEKDPDSLEALDGLARTRGESGNLTGEEEALRNAVTRHPESWRDKQSLATLYKDLGRFPEAEALAREAVADSAREASPPWQPHLLLAEVYAATDRYTLAITEANTALSVKPNAEALAIRAGAKLNLNQPDQAERDARDALSLDPDSVAARFELGHIQAVKGDYDGATASFKAVLALDPKNEAARANLQKLAQMGKE